MVQNVNHLHEYKFMGVQNTYKYEKLWVPKLSVQNALTTLWATKSKLQLLKNVYNSQNTGS